MVSDAKIAIQVSYSIKGEETYERETTPFVNFARKHPDWHCFIITFDEKDILEKDGVRIEVIPVWKWLLS